jgi:flagellar assembly factor FliW
MAEATQTVTAPASAPADRPALQAIAEDRILVFPDGLVGFPDARRFALFEPSRPGSPFRHLVSIDRPELGFVVCAASEFWPAYAAEVLRATPLSGEVVVLAIVTVPANPYDMTANLMAPLVIDCASRRAWQIVLDTGRWSTRHPLMPSADARPDPPSE